MSKIINFNHIHHLVGWKKLELSIFINSPREHHYLCNNTNTNFPQEIHSSRYIARNNFNFYLLGVGNNCSFPFRGSSALIAGHNFDQFASMSIIKDGPTLRDKHKPNDRTFKTPYGHIAALEWGKPDAPKKILCIHGWLDNAGSFECLIPYILDHKDNADKYHIIAIDHPGTGLSSHKPSGSEYTSFSTIIEMRRVIKDLEWDKFSLIGHSLGSHLSFLFACIYSHQIESLISIDLEYPIGRGIQNWDAILASSIEESFKYEYTHDDDPTTNLRVPVYSEGDAIKRLMDGHSNSLTKSSAQILLKRGATKQRWGYTFNRDLRLRTVFVEFRPDDAAYMQYLSSFFHSSLLNIRASRSPYKRSDSLRKSYYEIFEKNCPVFRDVLLDGTHHLHMNTPETVYPEICNFLEEISCNEKVNSKSKL